MKSIVKRCSVAAVLALAALMPDFRLLNTSPEGLALIADLEGCRLTPYQCSAGVWTSGIGHTAGVVPKGEITERQAAANLVADVMNVERRLAVCVPVNAAAHLRRAGQLLIQRGNRRGLPVDAGLVYQATPMVAGVRPAHPLGLCEWLNQ